jgi:hypothetical protein
MTHPTTTPPAGYTPVPPRPPEADTTRTRTVRRVIGGLVIAGLLLVGGVAVGRADNSPTPAAATSPAPAAVPEPAPVPAPEEGELGEEPTDNYEGQDPALLESDLAVGETVTWDDGLEAEILKVWREAPDEYSIMEDAHEKDVLAVKVKLTATDEAVSGLVPLASAYVGANGESAESAFNNDNDHMQDMPDRLAAGRSITGVFDWAVPEDVKQDVVVTFAPGYDYREASFTGRA